MSHGKPFGPRTSFNHVDRILTKVLLFPSIKEKFFQPADIFLCPDKVQITQYQYEGFVNKCMRLQFPCYITRY